MKKFSDIEKDLTEEQKTIFAEIGFKFLQRMNNEGSLKEVYSHE